MKKVLNEDMYLISSWTEDGVLNEFWKGEEKSPSIILPPKQNKIIFEGS